MDSVHKLTPKPSKAFAAPDPEICETMLDVRAGVDEIDRMLVALIARRQGYMDAAARIKPSREVVRDEARINQVLANVKAEAERQGQHDRAAQLRKKAEDTEQAIHAQVRKQQAARIKQEAAQLRQRAALAKSEGRHDEARAIMNEAENLERHALELAGPAREPKKPQDDKQMLLERIEGLEVRVERLSKALAQLQQSGR